MKILVFSDSHRCRWEMLEAIEREKPDTVIHLGDLQSDAEEIGYACPMLPLISVPGNCDGWTRDPLEKCIDFDGVRVLLSHGHIWGVKGGYERAIQAARQAEARVLLFGHTHRRECMEREGLWLLNPGAARSGYGVLEIRDGRVACRVEDAPQT